MRKAGLLALLFLWPGTSVAEGPTAQTMSRDQVKEALRTTQEGVARVLRRDFPALAGSREYRGYQEQLKAFEGGQPIATVGQRFVGADGVKLWASQQNAGEVGLTVEYNGTRRPGRWDIMLNAERSGMDGRPEVAGLACGGNVAQVMLGKGMFGDRQLSVTRARGRLKLSASKREGPLVAREQRLLSKRPYAVHIGRWRVPLVPQALARKLFNRLSAPNASGARAKAPPARSR